LHLHSPQAENALQIAQLKVFLNLFRAEKRRFWRLIFTLFLMRCQDNGGGGSGGGGGG